MEELQRTINQRYENKPRKVRFKIASSYSGRVLKHVYEDGQELESPEEEYPRSFIHGKLPRHLETEHLYGFGELQDPGLYSPPGLIAQRINVYRGGTKYSHTGDPPVFNDLSPTDTKPSVLDFGKIIIYTSNLRIIRSPRGKKELTKSLLQDRDGEQDYRGAHGGQGEAQEDAQCVLGDDKTTNIKDVSGCLVCGGSGCAPCALCHGSKLSMLANRFNESIRALRCPACNVDGLQPCHSCI
ncbi:glutaredoxin domain-containing cysteine-rich protein 2 [Amia ocellicauda]|uniref:glutaredoxin domain-containing cysteine-rich protein 2 n=1 Tax=Amia ocellicauda TaxID=2972642 RepID=UPI0034644EC9